MTAELDLLARAAAGDEDARSEAWPLLQRGLKTYFRAGGNLTLERCLGIDARARRDFARATRDHWLALAHGLCDGPTPWKKSCTLADELVRFQTAIWPAWRDSPAPPAGASELRTALFYVLQAAARIQTARGMPAVPATAHQLHAIVKSKGGDI